MRMRLFWQLIIAFVILIIFGIGGTMALVGATFRQIVARNLPATLVSLEGNWTASLADYYVAHDRSWAGVESRLDTILTLEDWFPGAQFGYVLMDANGAVVVERGDRNGARIAGYVDAAAGSPVVVGGQVVGRLMLLPPPNRFANRIEGMHGARGDVLPAGPFAPPDMIGGGRRNVESQLWRAFIGVAAALGSMMLVLAIIVGRRISAPIGTISAAAHRVAGGDLSVHVAGSSITEVDELARSFNQMTADLRRADELRRNMTADIAHELRTPLTIIKGKLEGIVDGVYAATPEHLDPVLEEANLLERLIDDLRVLSLAEAGQLPLFPEEVAVSDLLADTRAAFQREAAAQQVAFEIGGVPVGIRVQVDPQRMQQVLGNLVGNSLRYTPAGGQVTLSATQRDGMVAIAVADTGQGIAPEELPSIFERFYRSDKARSHNGHGAGLGLAIARQLVEAQGGSISATSTLGNGTTMTVELPIADHRSRRA